MGLRILHCTRLRDTHKLRSIMKHLDLKMENLEAAAEQAPKDLDHIKN